MAKGSVCYGEQYNGVTYKLYNNAGTVCALSAPAWPIVATLFFCNKLMRQKGIKMTKVFICAGQFYLSPASYRYWEFRFIGGL